MLIHLQLLPRLLLIEKQEDPESVLNAARTFIAPPTVLTQDMVHATPDGRDGREDMWDKSWDSNVDASLADKGEDEGSSAEAAAAAPSTSASAPMKVEEGDDEEDVGDAKSGSDGRDQGTSAGAAAADTSRHPLCRRGQEEDLNLRMDPRAFAILAGVRAALQCYREAQDVEVDRETLEDEERGTLQWSLLEMRNAALLQAVARAFGRLDWQEECRRQKRRKVHLYVQTKARQLRKRFVILQDHIKTAYGISNSFNQDTDGVDGDNGQVRLARSASTGSASAASSVSMQDDGDEAADVVVASSGAGSSTEGKHAGAPQGLHAWLEGSTVQNSSGERADGTARPVNGDFKAITAKL